MKRQRIIYLSIILIFSCIEPTLLDKDCNGVIGGDALVDDCGSCTGGTTNLNFNYFLGCDGECKGRQFDCTYPGDLTCTAPDPPGTCITACNGDYITDCNDDCIHKDDAREFDLCGVCDPCDNGTKGDDCDLWNTTCRGCTDPNAACDSYDEDATVYEQGSCISSSYYCNLGDDGFLDINTIIDLTITESDTCFLAGDENNCGPGVSICRFFDCDESESGLDSTQFIPCNPQLTFDGLLAYESDIGNDTCDYYGVLENVLYNFTSCLEFGYDGGTPEANFTDGDCNLVDCRGVHFSNDLCEETFVATDIDTLTNPPDTTIETTIIEGCINGENKIITTSSSGISDSIRVIGSTGWLGDGECDSNVSDGYLFINYGLDFDCIEHDYEGGDCYSLERVNSHVKNKSRSKIYYKLSKKKNKLKLSKLINQKN
mgnify:FL=1